MPLPNDPGAVWPPADIAPYTKDQAAWGAWWSGDEKALTATSGASTTRRRFWQRRRADDTTTATAHLHATLAADIVSTSADLLFGEPPDLTITPAEAEPGTGTEALAKTGAAAAQARLEELSDTLGIPNRLLEAAESCAATGGVFLRPMWDTGAADHPLLTVVDAADGVPDFSYGMLRAVTFHELLHTEHGEVWRHLERHEPGVILHGLYVGTSDKLGRRVPLTLHPSTAGLLDEVPVDAAITGGRPGIMARYVPNVLPNRKDRRYPIGRSDFAGCEPFLDALDEAWTSWMRDLRLGQARLLVADELLTPAGAKPGAARGIDVDRELFTGLNIADLSNLDASNLIHEVQFDIRVEQHERTVLALTEQVISTAGYSPQTFGLHIEGRAESGTALRIREGKTDRTVGRKRRYWAPAVCDVQETLLAIDRHVFGRPTVVARPSINWPESASDPVETATYVDMLGRALAASIATRVRLAQPHLDEDAVEAEVAAIRAEMGVGVPDPLDTVDVA